MAAGLWPWVKPCAAKKGKCTYKPIRNSGCRWIGSITPSACFLRTYSYLLTQHHALVRLATLLEGLDAARTILADGKPSERRISELTAPFLALAEGEELLLDRTAAAREREAALALGEALRARLAGDVVHEALHLGRLLTDHAESALVLILRGPR